VGVVAGGTSDGLSVGWGVEVGHGLAVTVGSAVGSPLPVGIAVRTRTNERFKRCYAPVLQGFPKVQEHVMLRFAQRDKMGMPCLFAESY
jgi:hypothetical protein